MFMEWLRSYRPDLVERYEELYARRAYAPREEQERLGALVRGARARSAGAFRRDPWRDHAARNPLRCGGSAGASAPGAGGGTDDALLNGRRTRSAAGRRGARGRGRPGGPRPRAGIDHFRAEPRLIPARERCVRARVKLPDTASDLW